MAFALLVTSPRRRKRFALPETDFAKEPGRDVSTPDEEEEREVLDGSSGKRTELCIIIAVIVICSEG